jgi:hypothetical protein
MHSNIVEVHKKYACLNKEKKIPIVQVSVARNSQPPASKSNSAPLVAVGTGAFGFSMHQQSRMVGNLVKVRGCANLRGELSTKQL